MIIRTLAAFAALLAVAAPIFAKPALPAPRYRIVLLTPPPGWTDVEIFALNASGAVVGSVGNGKQGAGYHCRAFLWKDGKYTLLPLLPGYHWSSASAISDTNIVVGDCFSNNNGAPHSEPFISEGNVTSRIRDLPVGRIAYATAVNDRGEVAGVYSVGDSSGATNIQNTAYIVSNGVRTDLGPSIKIQSVDSRGWVYGTSPWTPPVKSGSNMSSDVIWPRQFIWNGKSRIDMKIGDFTQVNPDGDYICSSDDRDPATITTADRYPPVSVYFCHNGVQKPLPVDIINFKDDRVFGAYVQKGTTHVSSVWQDGKYTELQNAVVASGGVTVDGIIGMNARGQIACWAHRGSHTNGTFVLLGALLVPVHQ